MNDKKKILILTRWFVPGFQAGGLIRTMDRLATNLAADFDVYVLTTNRDFNSIDPYLEIKTNQWLEKNGFKVMYLNNETTNIKQIKKIILEINPTSIYLKGLFDPLFNTYPLILKWRKLIQANLVLAPSGMLMETAIAHKTTKKKVFLFLFRAMTLHNLILFHATSQQEKESIAKNISSKARVKTIVAFPPVSSNKLITTPKEKETISIIYISRIHPVKKNLAYLLELLTKVNVKTSLTIAGPIEDPIYWEHCQMLIATLPDNISVEYIGKIENERVASTIQQHHLFCFPTTGENYGFVIIEALAAGRPILISDQTPWKNLSQHNAGWDLPLKDPQAFIAAIEKVATMDQDEFNHLCESALEYARQSTNPKELVNAYRKMLDSN